jgi:putative ABC transport system permease protein
MTSLNQSEPASGDTPAGGSVHTPSQQRAQIAGQPESFAKARLLENFLGDLKFACRQLYRNPVFSLIAAGTLALGIGAVLAVLQSADKALFQPLPYPDAGHIVMLWGHDRSTPDQRALISAGEIQAFDQSKIFTAVAGIDLKQLSYALTGAGNPRQIAAVHVSPGFFQILGVQPILGQGFSAATATAGNDTTAVISHHLWTQYYGSDPRVIGKPLDLDGQSYTIAAVMPADFSFPIRYQDEDIEAWMPESLDPMLKNPVMRNFGTMLAFARMPGGASLSGEQQQLDAIHDQLRAQFPAMNQSRVVGLYALTDELAGPHRTELFLLLGAVSILFLITCSNVGNLLLARGNARSQELGLRVALGAGRAALIRQLLTENVVLACLGVLGSMVVAFVGGRALSEYIQSQPGGAGFAHLLSAPALSGHGVSIQAVLVMAAVLVAAILLAAVIPAVALSATKGLAAIGSPGRATMGKRTHRMRTVSIISQVSLSLFLAVGAMLLVQSFERFIAIDPGFQVEHRLTYQLTLPVATYPSGAPQARFFDNFSLKVRSLPGVESVALIGGPPLTSWMKVGRFLPDNLSVSRAVDLPIAQTRSVSENYFAVMGIPLLSGRTLREGSENNSPPEVVVSKSLATRYWPQTSAIGHTLRFDLDANSLVYTIVGVVGDVHQNTLDQNTGAEYYLSYWNKPDRSMGLIVKTPIEESVISREIEASLHSIDRDQPFSHVASFDELVHEASQSQRTRFILLSLISGAALLLTAVGIFGLISYLVQQRTREIGIRLALGSGRSRIVFKTLKDIMLLVFVGIGAGIGVALGLSRFIEHLLFNVSALNPVIYLEAVTLLIAVALVACALPALRAAYIDPAITLRSE